MATVALSSTEAEYIALTAAAQEAIRISQDLREFRFLANSPVALS